MCIEEQTNWLKNVKRADSSITEIGINIKKIRIEQGLTQEILAEKSGISTQHLSNIERHKAIPSLAIFVCIANALDVTAEELMNGERKDMFVDHGNYHSYSLIDRLNKVDKKALKVIHRTILAYLIEWNRVFDD